MRLLLAIAVQNGWKLVQLDVKAAFLYGELKEERFMQLPPGYKNQKGQESCAKLHKAIYGLKQSPREWYAYLTGFLRSKGLQSCPFDPCVITNTVNGTKEQVIQAVYVDDMSIYGPETTVTGFNSQRPVTYISYWGFG